MQLIEGTTMDGTPKIRRRTDGSIDTDRYCAVGRTHHGIRVQKALRAILRGSGLRDIEARSLIPGLTKTVTARKS